MTVLALAPRGVLAALEEVAAAIENLCACDVDAMSGAESVEVLARIGPLVTRLQSVQVAAMSGVDDSGVWGLDGSRSARAFVQRTTGASAAQTGSHLKLAARLSSVLPLTSRALREGRVSLEHALVLSRGACGSDARVEALADPQRGEALLLAHADLAVDEFKVFVARWAYRVDPDAEDEKRRAAAEDFHVDLAATMDGVHVRGFLTPEVGESLATALAAVVGVPASSDGRSPSRRRHDALASVCQLAMDGPGLGTAGGVRPQLVVHVDLATLTSDAGVAGTEPAILQESGSPIPRRVLDRLACDSELTRIVFGPGSQVLDVGRSARTFTGPRRRALDGRDRGCRAPGCHAPPRLCEGHHILPWSHGGTTAPENGLLLCWAHHDWLHERDIGITTIDGGGLRFDGHDGRHYGTTYPPQLTLSG